MKFWGVKVDTDVIEFWGLKAAGNNSFLNHNLNVRW